MTEDLLRIDGLHIGFRNGDAPLYEQQIQQLLAEH